MPIIQVATTLLLLLGVFFPAGNGMGGADEKIPLEKIEDHHILYFLTRQDYGQSKDVDRVEPQWLKIDYAKPHPLDTKVDPKARYTLYFVMNHMQNLQDVKIFTLPMAHEGRVEISYLPDNLYPSDRESPDLAQVEITIYDTKEKNLVFVNAYGGYVQGVASNGNVQKIPLQPLEHPEWAFFFRPISYPRSDHLNRPEGSKARADRDGEIYYWEYEEGGPCGETPESCPRHRYCFSLSSEEGAVARDALFCLPWSSKWFHLRRGKNSEMVEPNQFLEYEVWESYPNPDWQRLGLNTTHWFLTRTHKILINFQEAFLLPDQGCGP